MDAVLLESEITESWKMLLGLNTEPLLKPSVGKWELGTTTGELGHKWRMLLPPVRKLYNYRMRGGAGIPGVVTPSVIMLASHWSAGHNTGLWLVMTLPRLPRTGHMLHMLHMLHAEHSFQMRNFNVRPVFIAEKV